MNKWGLMGLVLVISLMAFFSTGTRTQPGNVIPPAVKHTVANPQVKIDKDYGKIPLTFIPNKGQMDKQVYFYLQGKDKSVYFTSTGLTYTLAGPAENQADAGDTAKPGFPAELSELRELPGQRGHRARELSQPKQSQSRWVVKLDFVNARKGAKPECLEKSGTVISYFKGKAAEWQTGLQAASKIRYRDLWPGIDLVYYGTVNKMKYEFIVHPGADPAQIKLAYRGAENVIENRQGQLEVHTPMGSFSDDTPVAWQYIAGQRQNVTLKYALEKKNPSNPQDSFTYGFSVGEYDRNETLVLDPVVLVYCGYIGGSNFDDAWGIDVDASGCAYVTGNTRSDQTYFPVTVGPDLTVNDSSGDAFVAKVKADGTGLIYCGYIGGSLYDEGRGIAVDSSGCAYVSGWTNSDQTTFPVTVGPALTHSGGIYDTFVAKITADGTGLVFCGYIGGSGYDNSYGIAVDVSGCAYVTGKTSSTETTFPVMGGPDLIYNGGDYDAFVAKVKADGTGLDYCGYIGGSNTDYIGGIVLDASGCAYVTGGTQSDQTSFPVTVGPDLTYNGGSYDAFVAKINATGTALDYCGYIGGSSTDYGDGIALHASGCVYVLGDTFSDHTTFPVIGGPDLTCNGTRDTYVAKIRADGSGLEYCGYIGGSGTDTGLQIAVDASGCAYVVGSSSSDQTTFPVIVGPDLTYNGGDYDAFVAKVKADGTSLDYCGYIGGSDTDAGIGIVLDASGCLYVAGKTYSSQATFPVVVGPDMNFKGGGTSDAFVAKLSWADPTVNFIAGSGGSLTGETTQTVAQGGNCTAVTAIPDTGYIFVNWTGTGGFVTTTDNPLTVTNVTVDMTITANFALNAPIAIQLGAWNTTTPFNTPRLAHTSVVYNGYLYVLGGCDINDTRFNDVQFALINPDGSLGSWQYTTSFNTGRRGHTSVAYNGYLYVMGGTPSGGGVLNDVQFAPVNPDGSLGTWQYTTSFNTGRLHFASVVYNGYLYVIQGFYVSAAAPLTDVQVATIAADGTLGPWQNTTTFAPGRWGHRSIAYNQYLYTMGGGNWNGSYYTLGDVHYSSINADGSLNAWQGTTALDPTRDSFGLVQYGGNLIMTGGFNTTVYYDYVQYAATNADGTLGPWSRMTSFDKARGNHTSVVYNGYLYVIGGSEPAGTAFSDVQYAKINELSQPTHAVTFTAGSGGTTSGSLYQVITEGQDCAPVTAVPGTGYGLINWTGDGGFATTTDNPLTVTNVTTDMTITANFGFISLTGQVTDSGSNGIPNAQVVLYDTNFNQVGQAWTDSSGNYTFYDLAAGDYKVFFNGPSAGNFQDEWYNDKSNFDTADNVSITVGNTTTVNAQLADGGIITGRVTDTANNGIEGVNVQVCDLAYYWLYGATTDSNGDYTISGVKTGSFKVEFRPGGLPGNYVREWYNNQVSFESADVVAVTAGNITAGINAQLAAGGSISGRVTDTAANGIENVNINVFDAGGNQIAWSATDNDGYYTVSGIPTGNQKVQFWPGSAGNYMPQWYNNQGSFEEADTLLVIAGETVTGIDAQLAASGAISGRVTDASGTVGIANVEVHAWDMNRNWYPGTNTDNDGYYNVRGLPGGNYKVEFRTQWVPGDYIGEWYNDKSSDAAADIVTVTVGETTTGIDAALADGGAISGRVTDSSGTVGLANVNVQICDSDGNGYYGVSTDGAGYYTVHGLPAGSYKLQFTTQNVAGSYVGEWYNDKSSFAGADAVSVSVGQTTTGINAQLAEGGYISGRVTNFSGKGVANVNANIYQAGEFTQVCGTTDSSGYYTVKGVPAGDYQVHFWTGAAGNYLEEWYNDKNSQGEADPVTVTAGNTTGGINAQLATGGSISGKVMDSSLMGIANVRVSVFDTDYNWRNCTQTDSDGDYTIDRLPTGNYKIYFDTWEAGNYIREWYNDKNEFDSANTVGVTAGYTTRNINAVLASGGAVSGRVTDASGSVGIADVNVLICDLNWSWYMGTNTDSAGNYTLYGLPPGDYKIEFRTNWTPGNYVGEWYNDQDSFENANPVTVIANQTITGVDAALSDGGAISGRVTDSTGTVGIANVNINICDSNQYWLHGVSTDNSGYYTLYGIPAGTYKVQFYAQHLGNYANEWWANQRRFETAGEVTVTTGNTTGNIDAQLEFVGSITGTVTAVSTANPIENVRVYVYDLANNEMGNTWTGADGHYTINNLAPDIYKVYFDTYDVPLYCSEWYNDKNSYNDADEVTVNENAATTVDAALAQIQDDGYEPNDDFGSAAEITAGIYNDLVFLSPDGSYDGDQDWYKIYVGAEQAGKNLMVNLRVTSPYPENPPSWWTSDLDFDILDGTGQILARAISSSDNETLYIANLAEGWYYIALKYCTVNYGPGGTGVHADYSMTVAVDTAANLGIGIISGRVTNEQGQGIGGSPLLMTQNFSDWTVSFPIVYTDANGYYSIAYTPGNYMLQFNYIRATLEPQAPNYVSEYYNDTLLSAEAQVFSIQAGSAITGIDAVLTAGGSIAGTLTHTDGTPMVLANQGIAYAFDINTKLSVSSGYNDASGNYSIKYLPAGTYKILFRGRDENWVFYAREWYDNQPSLGTGADVVISTEGEVITGINNQFTAAAVLQGRVTNGSGDGIGNVRVNVYSVLDPDNRIRSVLTNGNGNYSINELFPGDVKIYFDADEQNTPYVSEWYNDRGSFNESDGVTVTGGQITSGIDAQLTDKGNISGRVTDASGTIGIANVNVEVYDLNNNGVGGANTDENGYYTVNSIPAGEYKLFFHAGGAPGDYLGEWYNHKASFENADAVAVNNGQTTGGIDAQLTQGGAVSGRVTDASGTLGIGGVDVTVLDAVANWIGSSTTDSNGDYTINHLPAGNYKIEFTTAHASGNYIGEFYNDKTDFASADEVTVTAGQTTGGVNAQLADGGGISGRVTNASGTVGIANVEIQIYDLNQYWDTGTNTDSEGNYTVHGLKPGDYKIMFNTRYTPGNYVYEWYNDKYTFESADTVSVTAGQTTTGIDVQLANGGGISGRITDETGTIGISNAWVAIYDLNNSHLIGVGASGDGNYAVYGLPAGTYKVRFNLHQPSVYMGEWYNDKSSFADADTVVVSVGLITGGIDARLATGGSVSGRVTDASGTVGIPSVNVQICDLNQYWYNSTYTDANGYYTINGLPGGDYKIQLNTNYTPGNYLGEWYNDKNSFENADPITVNVGQTTGGIDFQLTQGGGIGGRVTDATGTQGIPWVSATVYDADWNWRGHCATDSNGDYIVHGLPAGNYKVQFTTPSVPGDYVGEWYNDKGSFNDADVVTVTVGQTTTGIDAQLAQGGAISGRVTDASGTVGIAKVNVNIRDLNENWLPGVSTDSSGYYTVHGLPAGDYKIQFWANNTAGNYLSEWYNDKSSFENADAVTVTVGQTTAGIDAQLAEGGSLSGRVTNSSDSGIQNVDVQLYDLAYRWISSIRTDSNGDYTLSHLPAGSVKVYYQTAQAGNYAPEWYNDKGSFDIADAITITTGETQANIDVQLTDGGIISGRVSNEADEGIQGVRVRILYPDGIYATQATSDADGNYTVQGLAPGYYKVDFYPYNASGSYMREWYDNKTSVGAADLVEVTAGNTFIANAVLAAGGMVTGRVTNDQGTGIQGVRVQLKDLANVNRFTVTTNTNGDYTIKGIPNGNYKVFFNTYSVSSGSYLPEYYNDKTNFKDGETLTVTNGETFSGIDAVLAPGCTISGTVTDEAANPLELIDVYVYGTDGIGYGGTYTDGSGHYQLNGLMPGNYKVWFYPYERNYNGIEYYGYPTNTNYRIQWYNNKDNFAASDAVSTTLESPATGIDAVLTENGGGISGRITDSQGNGIANCYIALFQSEFDVDWHDSGYTDADGNYLVKGLAPGNWKLLVLAPGGTFYRREFYDNTTRIENATPVPVTAGQTTTGIDFVLDTGGLVTGRVTDSSGNGISNVLIRLVDPTLNKYLGWVGNGGRTDWNGNYSATALPGQWKVLFQTTEPGTNIYQAEYYNDQSAVENAAVITVDPEQTVSGIDAVLAQGGGKISGYVKDTGNNGLSNAEINLYDTQYQNPVGYIFADANGYFELAGLIPGTYKLHTSYNNVYPSEWYSDQTTFETANTVTVTEGGDTQLIIILGGSDPNLVGITGRVTDSAANGIPNVTVNLYDLNNTFIDAATTGSNGDYTLPGMPSGDYKIYFDGSPAGNYLSEWYDNKASFDEADVITVTNGITLENIDAQLTEGGIISGQVTNESSAGIENVQVVVRDLNQGWIDTATTDTNGNYSIRRLAGASYKVNFNANSAAGMYVSEWYSDKYNFTNANPIEVTTGTTTPVNAVLEAGGKISGRVVDQAQAGIQSVRVQVKDLANLNITTALTDANGNYTTFGLPVGDYKVYFLSYRGYIPEWYTDKDSFKNGDIVPVTLGNTTAVDAELTLGSSISGTVTDASANPLEWVEVYVCDTNGVGYGGVYTDSSGHYEVIGLPAGNYKVNFYPWELDHYAVEDFGLPRNYNYQYEWYNDQPGYITANVVPVTLETPTTGIDAVLTENCGTISGRITDGSGNGIAGCYAYAFQSTDDYDWYQSTISDADGNYFIKGMPPGNYIVFFMQPSYSLYRRQFYNNTPYVEQATPVVITAGQTVTGIDAVLEKGGIISGRVTNSSGSGISNVLVRPIDAATNQYIGWTTGNTTTDHWGYYTVNVRSGTWKILFETHNTYGGYRSEYYNDVTTAATAASVTVNPEQTVSGIDAVLSIGGGTIAGYVKDTAGTGLANAGIDIYDTQFNIPAASASTDASGYFAAPGLLPGNYTIYARYNNVYPSEWYSDKTTYETADSLLVSDGRTTPVTIILGGANANFPGISGRVRNYDGTGLEQVEVKLYDLNQQFIVSAATDANGDYAFYDIPAGDYKLYADATTAGNYISEWYQNTFSFEEAETLTVTADIPQENIDVGLTAGGIAAGHITNESGQGIEGVRVVIRDLQNAWIAAVNSDASGNYAISRLIPATYKVLFRTDNAGGLYVSEWYNDKENFNTADMVVVPAGETTTLDVTLAAGGAVSGTVTDSSANPIEFMTVDIYGLNSQYITSGFTDSSGHYLVKGIPVGTYKVNFNPWELNYHGVDWYGMPRDYNYQYQWYNQQDGFVAADEAAVTVGNTTSGIDAVMDENEGGIISGRITNSSGSGIAGCYVYAFESIDNQMDWYVSEYSSGTGPDGNYEIKGLHSGNYIVLFFSQDTVYKREFYNNTLDSDLAARVPVTAGQTTPGIDAVLEKAGVITGRVTDSKGNGLKGVTIRMMEAATNKYLTFVGNNTQTDENGEYEAYVHPGQWKVMFQSYAMSVGGYVSEFYNNRSTVETATVVTAAATEPTPNIDAVLSYGGGKISGYVKDPGNTGLRNAQVNVFDTQYKVLVGNTAADSSGYFEMAGLIPGNYTVYTYFFDVYPPEWYSDQSAYETAKPLAVTAGGNTYIEVVLGGPDPVNPGEFRITSPNGGESLTGGTIYPITWTATGIDPGKNIIIEYSLNSGTKWSIIASAAAATGSYDWTVPAVSSGTCLVKITTDEGDEGRSDTSDEPFTIVTAEEPGIRLMSPKRWLEITAGTVQDITWTSTGNVNQVVIEYSIDSGITWSMIANSAPNTGSYQWAVPDTPSRYCRIRIRLGEGDNGSVPFDMTDTDFAIVTTTVPTLTITSPNGGETWRVGSTQTITWVKTGNVPNVKIEYTVNGGSSWLVISASTANTGSYQWSVPDSPSGECKVRVSDIDGNPTDMSNAVFTIQPLPTITLTSPNGGETWEAGSNQEITWTWSEGRGDLKIEYSADGGTSWNLVTSSADDTGIYNWTVPDTPSENCLVRIGRSDTEEGPADISDGVFTIEAAPLLFIEAPNGGEKWKTGDSYRITWTAGNLEGNVVIDLYRGDDFDCSIGTAAVNDGRLEWKIPENFKNAEDYRVVIHKDHTEDYSDTAFSITDRKPNHPDFNNDGKVDILWRNRVTGSNEVWYMDGVLRIGIVPLPSEPGLDWSLVGTGDFNRDGKVDLLWRRSTDGQNVVWYMDGIMQKGVAALPSQPDVNWQIAGTGDFNGDGKTDILWRHAKDGRNQVWMLNGITVTAKVGLPARQSLAWGVAGLGDFNDDEKIDILWRNSKNGSNEVWFMDGTIRTGTMVVQDQPRLDWQMVAVGDFNRDGHADVLWRRNSDGKNMVWYMDGIMVTGYEFIEARADLNWKIVGNGSLRN